MWLETNIKSMKIELSLSVNDTPVGANTYRCGNTHILTPLVRILDNFSGSVLDWAARTPQASLNPVQTAKFLDRNKDYMSPEVYRQMLTAEEKRSERHLDKVISLEKQLFNATRYSEVVKVKKQLKATKKLVSRLVRKVNSLYDKTTTQPVKYFRIYSLSFCGETFSKVSYGATAGEALERFRRIYKELNWEIHIEQITNPKLKHVLNYNRV